MRVRAAVENRVDVRLRDVRQDRAEIDRPDVGEFLRDERAARRPDGFRELFRGSLAVSSAVDEVVSLLEQHILETKREVQATARLGGGRVAISGRTCGQMYVRVG